MSRLEQNVFPSVCACVRAQVGIRNSGYDSRKRGSNEHNAQSS